MYRRISTMKIPSLVGFIVLLAVSHSCGQRNLVQSGTTTTPAKVFEKSKDELTAENIAQGRDLLKYDDGGFFDCRGWVPLKSPQCDESKLKTFVWQKWSEKRRGYIRVTYDSVDAISTSHIFIEPDESGKWSVIWRIVRWHSIPQLSNQITNIERITSIERID